MLPLLLGSLAMGPGPLFEQALRPLQHVTAPRSLRSLSAESCGECHVTILQQWQRSRHARSYSNRIFQVSYRLEPMAWCRNCHAPLGARVAAEEGVSCAACHVRDGAVLGAREPSAAALAAHPVRVTKLLARSDLCAGCHQFNFPLHRRPLRYSDEPMQDTVAEWRRSGSREPCQGCHMGAAGHGMPGAHDAELLRRSITARVEQRPDGRVRATLRSSGAGHRVPTGDPFRRLRLELCRDRACAEVLQAVSFGRRFRRTREAWALAQDLTIPPPDASGEASQSLELVPEGRPLFFRLSYRYAAAGTEASLRPDDIAVEVTRGPVLFTE